jgi:Zn-finger nucleic acid-binding protein
MARCPACDSMRIVIRVDVSREALCVRCGTRWTQRGNIQSNVRRPPLFTRQAHGDRARAGASHPLSEERSLAP